MKRPSLIIVAMLILSVILQACNLPTGPAPIAIPQELPATDEPVRLDVNQALTLAVQTLSAAATPTVPSETPTQTFTAAPPTDTPIVGVHLTVDADTNCREGPSTDYDIIMLFSPGMTGTVVGKYGGEYWIIEYPGGFGATCWLWGGHATVIGNTASLVEGVPPPLPPTPTAVLVAPAPPKGVHTSCSTRQVSHTQGLNLIVQMEWTIKILWKDQSDNENGFSIYKDGSLLGTAGPNATSYTDKFRTGLFLTEPVVHTYGVQAYNDYGASAIKDVELVNCN